MPRERPQKDEQRIDFGPIAPFYPVDHAAEKNGRNADFELDCPAFFETHTDGATFIDARHTTKDHAAIHTLPPPNSTLHMIATGKTSGWQVIERIQQISGSPIAALWLSTLSMSLANVEALTTQIDDGTIRRVSLVASCYFKSTNDEIWHRVFSELTKRGQPVAGIRSHAKVSVLHFTSGDWFTIETSANLRSSGNIEQYTITNSEPLARFHAGWIDDVIRDSQNYQ